MATTAPSRATHTARRTPPTSASPPPSSSIARGATARSAVTPRVSSTLSTPGRRQSLKGAVHPATANGETRETLSASLKQETEKKEQLLVQLQDKDTTIATLKTENATLTSSLHAAETRLTELYADQNRMEEEMAARIEVSEKLRNQIRDLEKEKRDIQRRYNEQTSTFEAERQAFYDNEQHLKSRIQSLTQARKQTAVPPSPSVISVVESEADVEEDEPSEASQSTEQDINDPQQEPAEMTALRLELSTLSTSYTSLQSTLVLLQSQLVDLKRVNNELQEENESYNILLRERTLNGQFDVSKMGGTSISEVSEASAGEEEETDDGRDSESFRSRNTGRSSRLDRVDEIAEEHEAELDPEFQQEISDKVSEPEEDESQAKNPRSRHSRKRSSVSAPRGESLANLPITGPGLDLAAELGRAENKDMFEGRAALDTDRSVVNPKTRKGKKSERKVSSVSEPGADATALPTGHVDIETLRNEVKSLKDANKALSLYASKIIDRIISQEGFEHVLAVDYDKNAPTPSTAQPPLKFTTFSNLNNQPQVTGPAGKKARPQSAVFSFSSTPTTPTLPQPERLTTFSSSSPGQQVSSTQTGPSPPKAAPSSRASRRSMSFDWKSFSMFGGGEKKAEPAPTLRPLTLKPGAGPTVTSARKLETYEDEEDRQTAGSTAFSDGSSTSVNTPVTATAPSRFSFFRRASLIAPSSETSSINSNVLSSRSSANASTDTSNHLTQEALEQAEVENTIAALDAHERELSAEIAKGSPGGFTEISRRSGDRRSSRRSGSGSTVWSAGMSKGESDE
ncbi:hypothetical protein ABKN59_000896 [Abortiporus biennis]